MNQQLFMIDKVLGIEVDPEKYLNEFNTLIQLKTGMIALYNNVKPLEMEILNKTKGFQVMYVGENPHVPEQVRNLLPCFFHWFGNSLCNYARLNGYIVSRELGNITDSDLEYEPEREKIRKACNEYINGINELSEVLKWRHKVSAHFALTDPRKDDNIATLEASVIDPVDFVNDRFRTGVMIYSKGTDDINHESEIPSWSLTETFEILINRFWPEIVLNH